MNYLVFYAGLLYGEYDGDTFRMLQVQCDPEIYNGGYFYLRPPQFAITTERWYRMDGTPILDVDVPVNLKAMLLLLN